VPRSTLTHDDSLGVLAGEQLVRVAFRDSESLYLIPLGYVWLRSALYGATDPGRKTEIAARNPAVAFQVDSSTRTGFWEWKSVTGEGRFELVEGPEKQEALEALQPLIAEAPEWWRRELAPKVAAGALAVWRIRPTRVDGRRYGPASIGAEERRPARVPMMTTPLRPPARIETERLVLRPWCDADVDLLHEALGESVEHLKPWIPWATPGAPTPDETSTRLRKWREEFESGANFVYATFDRAGRLIGGVGLYPRVGPGRLEIGYWIRRLEAGRGFATEASRALTHAAFNVPGIDWVEIHCDTTNLASRRVPEKLGYRLAEIRRGEHRPDGQQRDLAVFELAREAYAAYFTSPRENA
jgi:RimJ/RimL family protein N-acetyltransferase/nitroimidazol reductase NimA-like FMN-containing flavoprotein (pyridoxamine 5'-phosphate oxidase superfamily)